MILLFVLLLALGWAVARGARLSNLASLPLRGSGLALAAFGIQAALIYFPVPVDLESWQRSVLLVFSYALLAGFVWWNRRMPGIWLLGIGLLANWIVILANGGYMPVTYDALLAVGKSHLVASASPGAVVFGTKDILLAREETRLWFLSDIFVIPPPFPIPSIFSVGDALIALGLLRFLPAALGAPTRKQATHSAPTT